MTTYYTVTGIPVAQTRASSSQVRGEFVLVQTGFTNVNTDITAKGAIIGQTWTGTHTFPATTFGVTASFGATGTAYATLDFVNAVATNAALPGQVGNSGKFLTTNGTIASWSVIPAGTVIRSARTSNTILVAADAATLIDITSGTFSQTFTAATTLASGWWCYLRNAGTGDITVDPNGAELIDGLTTYVMYPGECRLVQCDGTGFNSIVLHGYRRDFTASSTWTKPPGYKTHGGLAWSAGSSGQRNNDVASSVQGGSGGGCWPFLLNAVDLGSTETVTIGAGGTAVTTVAGGVVGGNTSFGSWFTVFGGPSYQNAGSIGTIQASGTDSFAFGPGATGATPGDSSYGGTTASSNASAVSGNSIYGGAAGGSVNASGVVRAAGTSKLGGNGGAASIAGNGTAGTAPAGGGGATQTGTQSGAGARGELRIWGVV